MNDQILRVHFIYLFTHSSSLCTQYCEFHHLARWPIRHNNQCVIWIGTLNGGRGLPSNSDLRHIPVEHPLQGDEIFAHYQWEYLKSTGRFHNMREVYVDDIPTDSPGCW